MAFRKENYSGQALQSECVAGFREKAITTLGGTTDKQQALVAEIREADDYLEALRTAQPLINAVQNYGEVLLADMDISLAQLAITTEVAIDE